MSNNTDKTNNMDNDQSQIPNDNDEVEKHMKKTFQFDFIERDMISVNSESKEELIKLAQEQLASCLDTIEYAQNYRLVFQVIGVTKTVS